jgi:HK97 family phage major capsid protein
MNGFQSFAEFLTAVRAQTVRPGTRDLRLQTRGVAAGSSEAVPSDGGFFVASEFANRLFERAYQTGEILSRCFQWPITSPNSNGLVYPQFDESSRANGSRLGGVQMYWQNEADTATASKPKFGRGELTLKKLTGLCYLTDEILRDTAALDIFATIAFSREMAFTLEAAIVGGTGADSPLGVLNSPALIKVAKESGQAAGTIVANNVVNAWSRMWAPSRKTAVWIVNQQAEKQLPTLSLPVGVGGSSIELYHFAEEAGEYNTLAGIPIIPVEYCPVAGLPGDLMCVDFSRYIVAAREAQTAVSMHVAFLLDEQAFRFTLRVDGAPLDKVPVTPLNGTETQSPFVAIDTR